MFDMIARWLVPEERTLIFACILPSSLSKSATLLQQRQRAHAGEVGCASRRSGLAVEASTVRSPLALPS